MNGYIYLIHLGEISQSVGSISLISALLCTQENLIYMMTTCFTVHGKWAQQCGHSRPSTKPFHVGLERKSALPGLECTVTILVRGSWVMELSWHPC